jgi:WD40 repeat protein
MAWSNDGQTVAAHSENYGITLYEPARKSVRFVKTALGGPYLLCFEPSGRYLLALSWWGSYCSLIDVSLATQISRFHTSELSPELPVDFALHGRAWWQGAFDSIHRILPLRDDDGMASFPQSRAIHPAGRLLATPTNRAIILSDLHTGKRVGLLPINNLSFCRFDARGNLFAQTTSPRGGFQPCRYTVKEKNHRYEFGSAERLEFFTGQGLAVSPDGRFVVGGGYEGAAVFDRKTGQRTALPQADVRYVVFHPTEPLVACFGFSSGSFRIWEATTGKLLHGEEKAGWWMGEFSPDGKFLVLRNAEVTRLSLWSVKDKKHVQDLGAAGRFAISPDSRCLAVAEANGKVRLTRIADGTLIAHFDAPAEDYISDMTFSPDGRYLIGTNFERNQEHVWDLWRLRRRLADLKLDWEKDAPPDSPAGAEPIVVELQQQKK